jgi:membrane associated rhomboid family serine protease
MPIRLTPAVKGLLIACFALFIIQQTADQFFGGNVVGWLGLVPSAFALNFKFWQLFTYPFLHGDVMHLVLNMMMLVFIGSELESVWGLKRFLRFYFMCSTAGGLLYLLLQMVVWGGDGLHTPMVGASGAIYGLLMAYGLIFGERVLLFMMLFPMKAKHFVWVLAGIEFMSSIFSGRGGLSSAAHLGGMAAGFLYLWGRAAWTVAMRQRQGKAGWGSKLKNSFKKSGKKKVQHLKLVIDNDKTVLKSADEDGEDDSGPKTWH